MAAKSFKVSTKFTIKDRISRKLGSINNALNKYRRTTNDASKATDRLARNQNKLKARNLGSNFKGLSAGLVGFTASIATATTAIAGLNSVMGRADQIGKMSRRLGISTETLSLWQAAAAKANITQREFDGNLRRFNRRLQEARKGTGEAKKGYDQLGLSAKNLSALSPEDRFRAVADRLSEIKDQGLRARITQRIFGDEGVKMANLVENGYAGIQKEMDIARSKGLAVSEEMAKSSERAGDLFTDVGHTIRGQLTVALDKALPSIIKTLEAINKWTTDNKALTGTLIKVGIAVAGGLAALATLGVIVTVVGTAFTFLGSMIGFAGGVLLALASPFVWIPTLLVTGAILAIKHWDAIKQTFSDIGTAISRAIGNAIDWAIKKFNFLKDKVFGIVSSIAEKIRGAFGFFKSLFPEKVFEDVKVNRSSKINKQPFSAQKIQQAQAPISNHEIIINVDQAGNPQVITKGKNVNNMSKVNVKRGQNNILAGAGR